MARFNSIMEVQDDGIGFLKQFKSIIFHNKNYFELWRNLVLNGLK